MTDGRAPPSGGFRVEWHEAQAKAKNLIYLSQVDAAEEENMADGKLQMTAVHAL